MWFLHLDKPKKQGDGTFSIRDGTFELLFILLELTYCGLVAIGRGGATPGRIRLDDPLSAAERRRARAS